MQDYSWRSYTTPNIHSPYGIGKDILRNLDSVDYLDNQQGDLWTHPELGFVVAAHMDSTLELGLVVAAAHMDSTLDLGLVVAPHMDYPPEMGLVVAALDMDGAPMNFHDQLLVVARLVLYLLLLLLRV